MTTELLASELLAALRSLDPGVPYVSSPTDDGKIYFGESIDGRQAARPFLRITAYSDRVKVTAVIPGSFDLGYDSESLTAKQARLDGLARRIVTNVPAWLLVADEVRQFLEGQEREDTEARDFIDTLVDLYGVERLPFDSRTLRVPRTDGGAYGRLVVNSSDNIDIRLTSLNADQVMAVLRALRVEE